MLPSSAPQLILAVDRKGQIILCQGPAARNLSADLGALIGAPLSALDDHHALLTGHLRRAMHGETLTAVTPLGRDEVEIAYYPTRTASNRPGGAIAVAPPRFDDEEGEQSDAMMRALIRATSDVLLVLDSQGRYVDVAPTNPSLLYRPADELTGKTLHEVFPAEQADVFLAAIQDSLRTRQTVRMDHSLPFGDQELWFNAAITPLTGDRVVWFARDITERRQHDQALEESEERYRRLFDSIADICIVIDRQWRYLHINQAASRITRVRKESIIGHTVEEVIRNVEEGRRFLAYRQVMETGQPRSFTAQQVLLPECLPGFFEVLVYPVAEGIMCVAHDVTERTIAEEALRESEERYHTLFEETSEAIFITARDGKVVEFNQAALTLFGYTRAETKTLSASDFYAHDEDRLKVLSVVEKSGSVRDFPAKMQRKDGKLMDCLVTASVRRSPDGELEGYQGIIRDVTAQKQAAEALRESEARFRAIFEGASFGITMFDLSGRPMLANPALLAMLGYTEDEFRELSLADLIAPEDAVAHLELFKSLARGERDHYQAASKVLTQSGQDLWAALSMSLVWDQDDRPVYVVALIEDISERKEFEDSLRESEERYRRLVEHAPEPIAVHMDGKLVYLNMACARLLGAKTPDDLVGKPILDFVHPDFREVVTQRIEQTQREGKEVPLLREKFIRLDGAEIDVEVVAIPLDFHGQRATQMLIHDISEQVRAQANERALADAITRTATALNTTLDLNEVLSLLLSSIGQVVPHDSASIMLVEDGIVRIVGHHGWEELGHREEIEALRLKIADIPNLHHMVTLGKPLIIPDLEEYPSWVKMPHTNWIRSYAGAPIISEGETIGFINLESGKTNFFTSAHAERLQTFAEHAAIAIRNARLYAELQHHAAELEARNRDLDAFSHTVAHDLKAPLHVILGYSSLLLSDYTDELSEEIRGHLGYIEEYSRKLDTMIEGMMLLAQLRNAEARAMPAPIAPLVRSALERFQARIAERGITVEIERNIPQARVYSPWIEEVFANLIENAIKYLGADNAAPRIVVRGKRLKGGMCRYEVQDNGIGIAPEHHQDLFKMFTRVHPGQVKGAGLGLSIVERIVTKLGGQVGVESEPGQGSTFWFTLPSA